MIKSFCKILPLILVVAIAGCSYVGTRKNIVSEPTKFVKTGSIIDVDRIKYGGKLLIIPFKAGENVELNDQIDKVSLRIVKGIAEALLEGNSKFQILLDHNADEADIVIKGFITGFKTVPKWKNWFPGKKNISLSVEGKMIDVKTQSTICVFQDRSETSKKEEDHKHLGLTIGQNIGQFILSNDE
ncbi:MAG: hypothetical protein KKD07_04935 [Candidatus Omnitrophica bacterium]|nr:hypothetical protein [Candidatus Omnitrophota bacterium]MBU1995519.1 hypothetical protein [Candidatus Omnitrophota bacterium]MBU4333766.1 hypothetical protein [Candidatus Omnitrophota bacterium]